MVRISDVLTILAYLVSLVGFIPVFPYVDTAVQIGFPIALGGAVFFDRRKFYPLSGLTLTIISSIIFAWYLFQFSRDNIGGPMVNILVLLLAVRLVAEKNSRNYLQIFTLSLFSLAASSLFDLSGFFLFYLMLLLIMISAALFLMTFHASDENLALPIGGLKKLLMVSFLMPAAAFPLMLVFFVILPRAQFPLWNLFSSDNKIAGFTDKVEPGRAESVGSVHKVAFRAECQRLLPQELYWRVTVLNKIVGDSWVRGEKVPPEIAFPGKGRVVRQVIYPEPGHGGYLPTLNFPRQGSGYRIGQSADYVYMSRWPNGKRLKFEANSVLVDRLVVHKDIDRQFYLQVPQNVSPKIVALGRKMAVGATDERRLAEVEKFFLNGGYRYTTTGLPVGQGSLESFLFTSKRGNCEFFASAFALLLRASGVPARLVGGYYGGDYNEIGGYYVVTEDRAHVWVEANVAGRGWVFIDPSKFAMNAGSLDQAPQKTLRYRFELFVDGVSYLWNQVVINYDLDSQLQLLRMADNRLRQFDVRSLYKCGAIVAFGIMGIAIFAAGIRVYRRRVVAVEEKVLNRFLAAIHRTFPEAEINAATGLHELAGHIHDSVVDDFVTIYGGAIYRGRSFKEKELSELLRLVKLLEKRPAARKKRAKVP